jgi:hypothetical protein
VIQRSLAAPADPVEGDQLLAAGQLEYFVRLSL